VSYNISQTLFGGTVPLIAAALVASTGSAASPAIVVVAFSAVAFASTLVLKRYGGRVDETASRRPLSA